jgi:hypothetical protein
MTQTHHHAYAAVYGHVILARSLLTAFGADAGREVEQELEAAAETIRTMGYETAVPLVLVEQARLAEVTGNDQERERALREAHDRFVQIGAAGHAERIAAELAPQASGDASR